jgi:hypothetical protein
MAVPTQNGKLLITSLLSGEGAHGTVVVEALCYKPEGRGLEIR